MPAFRMSRAAEILGVSDDTVRRWAESGRLPAHRDAEGRLVVEGTDLARLSAADPGRPGRSAARTESTRNHFTGIVTRVVRDRVAAQVELQAGPFRVVSLITREAADELGLTPGMVAVASVKATNVTIERTESA